ncbi:MAG: hypothetical protein K8F91_05610 [Candidatus Obscuribacterales bacterium]|nr:hypothetical protein [Candidatus Obscuribacterales bacterium]
MLASFCYSLLSFPQYLDAARNLRRGENLYADNRLIEALIAYGRALHAVPSSENVRVSAAIALFKYGGELPCELAMVYLTGIDLSERKWQEITEVMPPKYDSQFKTEKN